MKEFDRGYRLVVTRRARKNASEAKSMIPRDFYNKISHNQRYKRIKVCDKFGIKVPNSNRKALMMDRMTNNTLWEDTITKYMSALERLGVFQ